MNSNPLSAVSKASDLATSNPNYYFGNSLSVRTPKKIDYASTKWYFFDTDRQLSKPQIDKVLSLNKCHWLLNDEVYFNNQLQVHNEGAPAIHYRDLTVEWYKNGALHNEHGPAVVTNFKTKFNYGQYFLNGRQVPEQEWQQRKVTQDKLDLWLKALNDYNPG